MTANSRATLHTGIKRYAAIGLGALIALFGGLGGWAAVAEIDGAVIAPGVVEVESRRQTVQHLEGGIVSALKVRDGDRVEAGQTLVRLDDVKVRADLDILRGRMFALRAKQVRLRAERDGRARVDWDLLGAAGDRRERSRLIESQRQSFAARRTSLTGEIELLTQRMAQLHADAEGLRAQRRSKARQIALLQEELVGLEKLYAKGYAPKTRILGLQREAERLAGERAQHASQIARAEKDIAETRIEILQRKREFRREVVAELEEVEGKLSELAERVVAARDQQRRLAVRAPKDGTVVNLRLHTVGGVLAAGDPILDLVPDGDRFELVARVAPRDIDKLSVGQPAEVRFSAFNMQTTPRLSGRVQTVSADRLVDQRSGEAHYEVRIRVPPAEIEQLDGVTLIPGMPVEVFINTGARTALSYLAKPFTDTLARTFREE